MHCITWLAKRALCNTAAAFALGTIAIGGANAADAPYPARPVKIVVPLPSGGPADAIVRTVAAQLSARLGQPFVPEFKGGAAGIIGTDAVAKALPDGYTLLAATSDMLVNNTAAFKSLPYDPRRDFSFITQIGSIPLVFAVNSGVPANNLREFAAYAKERHGQLSYGSWGYGINAHIAGETLLNRKLQLGGAHVPYRGLAPLTQDLVGQQITASFGVAPAFAQFVGDKRLKVLGVTGASRIMAFPDVPTFAEQGFNDDIFKLRMWMALLAPAGTPQRIVERLNREVVQIVSGEEFQALLGNAGLELVANTPEQARENLLRELELFPQLMRDIGLEAQ